MQGGNFSSTNDYKIHAPDYIHLTQICTLIIKLLKGQGNVRGVVRVLGRIRYPSGSWKGADRREGEKREGRPGWWTVFGPRFLGGEVKGGIEQPFFFQLPFIFLFFLLFLSSAYSSLDTRLKKLSFKEP